jgi:hypothetical protein
LSSLRRLCARCMVKKSEEVSELGGKRDRQTRTRQAKRTFQDLDTLPARSWLGPILSSGCTRRKWDVRVLNRRQFLSTTPRNKPPATRRHEASHVGSSPHSLTLHRLIQLIYLLPVLNHSRNSLSISYVQLSFSLGTPLPDISALTLLLP